MTHTKTTVEKKTWMIYLIYKWKMIFTGLLKNGMDCLSKQWAFMMQGDICTGREVVRSKPFTRWLGSCREAVLCRAGRNETATSKRQRKGKMNCQDNKYRCIYNRSWKLPVFLASTDRKRLWQCSRTVISTRILCGVGPEAQEFTRCFPLCLMCMVIGERERRSGSSNLGLCWLMR